MKPILVAILLLSTGLSAQEQRIQHTTPLCSFSHLDRCLVDIAKDQAGIWTSPLRAQKRDLLWIVPFSAGVGASIHFDQDALSAVGFSKSRVDFGKNVSRAGSPYVLLGSSAALYLAGSLTKKPHLQETGRLGGEAIIDSLILTEGLKLATQRDRPFQGNGHGDFWPNGTKHFNSDSSMPSGHATAAWALAKVISSEYPDKPWLKLLGYGAATTISVSRVLARDHFPSDVFVGSTFGYLTGMYVIHHHAEEYRDYDFSFSSSPMFDARTRTVGMTLNITPPQSFDECRLLNKKIFALVKRLDRTCTEAR